MFNWISYYYQSDGYGRFSSYYIRALRSLGYKVKSMTMDEVSMPRDLQEEEGIDIYNNINISCLPPYYFQEVEGTHYLYTMTEGSRIPGQWVDIINNSALKGVIVPCSHNKKAFIDSRVNKEILIVPGGTEPKDFPLLFAPKLHNPYTFLVIADRGFRKGWDVVREAFYMAFGGRDSGRQDVRLLVKARPESKIVPLLRMVQNAEGADPRISFRIEDDPSPRDTFSLADCLVMPSYCEGWGMIPREAACTGMPVIVQKHSGFDDGYTDEWALVLESGKLAPVPSDAATGLGEWMVPNMPSLVETMCWCYEHQEAAKLFGLKAGKWIRENQTWVHAVKELVQHVC